MTGYINSGLPIRAIKYIAAGDHIHCATAIFHHKLVTTQVTECGRSFLLPLPLGEGRGEGSPVAIPGTELLSGFSNLERSAYRIKLDPLPGVPPVIESISGEASGKTSGKILEAIRQNPQVTIPELSAQIGVTSRSIERNLQKLQDEKRLLRIGPAKGGHWQVVESSKISLPLEP